MCSAISSTFSRNGMDSSTNREALRLTRPERHSSGSGSRCRHSHITSLRCVRNHEVVSSRCRHLQLPSLLAFCAASHWRQSGVSCSYPGQLCVVSGNQMLQPHLHSSLLLHYRVRPLILWLYTCPFCCLRECYRSYTRRRGQ